MPGKRGSFRGHTFLHTSIAEEHIRPVCEQIKVVLVVRVSGVSLCDRETNGICKSLAEGTGRHLDAVGVVNLWMAGRARVELTESLQVIHRQVVTHEMQHDVLQRTCMAIRENETVAVDPV